MTLEELEQGKVLAVDKPYGWSSFQVVNKIKWQIKRELGIKKFKIGHAGTLDPLATGLLLICVGKATKRIDELQTGSKVYSGTMVIGATTPCYDMERAVDCYYPIAHLTPEKMEEAREQFVGTIDQVPPMFSAIKVAGSRAYTYARDGQEVAITPKAIEMYEFSITQIRNMEQLDDQRYPMGPVVIAEGSEAADPMTQEKELYRHPQGHIPEGLPQVDFRIHCGKGTYIRSIARDYGLALGSGAFLTALRRERIGEYDVKDALAIVADERVAL